MVVVFQGSLGEKFFDNLGEKLNVGTVDLNVVKEDGEGEWQLLEAQLHKLHSELKLLKKKWPIKIAYRNEFTSKITWSSLMFSCTARRKVASTCKWKWMNKRSFCTKVNPIPSLLWLSFSPLSQSRWKHLLDLHYHLNN